MATAPIAKTKPAKSKSAMPMSAVKTTKTIKPVKAIKATTAPKATNGSSAAAKPMGPIKQALNKSALAAHLSTSSGVEPKAVKAVLASLEATMLASVSKKGLGAFTIPGLLKVNVIKVPAKPKRKGLDPFTKVERVFAAKPATVKVKLRSLKKLKDAAL